MRGCHEGLHHVIQDANPILRIIMYKGAGEAIGVVLSSSIPSH